MISQLLSAGPWLWGTKTMDEPRPPGLQVWGQMALSGQLSVGGSFPLFPHLFPMKWWDWIIYVKIKKKKLADIHKTTC